jgi:hypothetical protein
MAELDPFEARLAGAVRAFADRAQTDVDAAGVAARAIGRRPTGPWAVLHRSVPVPVPVLAVAVLLIAFAGWSVAGGGPFPVRLWVGPATPTPTVSPTPTPSPSPLPSPLPSIEPLAPAYVTGTASSTVRSTGSMTLDADGIAHTEGMVIAVVTSLDDARVTGTGTYDLAMDASGSLGFTWGTLRLEAGGATWAGACSGSTGEDPGEYDLACWLGGSGPYDGLTFYVNHRLGGSSEPGVVLGVILPGEPPSP